MADNAGYDSAQLVSELRAIHTDGKQTWGISKLLLVLKYFLFFSPSPPSLEVRVPLSHIDPGHGFSAVYWHLVHYTYISK